MVFRFVSAGPDQRRTESSDATGHVRGSYTFIDDKGVQHSVHYIAGPETGYRVLKNVKAPHFPSWYPLEPSRPSRPVLPSLPSGTPGRPSFGPPVAPDFGGDDYGDGDKNIEDIFGGPQEQLSTAASGHAKPPKPALGSGEKEERPFDNDFGGSFDDTVGGRPTSTIRPLFGGGSTPSPPFGGPSKPTFLDDDLQGGFLPTTTRRPFGGPTRPPTFLDEDESGGFGGRPGGTKPSFGGTKPLFEDGDFRPKPGGKPFDDSGSGGVSGGATDEDFMEDLFKPSGPTGGGIGGEVKPPKRPEFGGVRPPVRPSTTRPPLFEDSSGGGSSGTDDFELFGDKGTTSRPGGGRPFGSKEDMNYGFFDGHKGPMVRPGGPRPVGGKEESGFDFFGEKPGGGGPTTRPPSRPPFGRPSKEDGFDLFDEDKRPPKRPPGKDDYDFFGTDSKGSTPRPFRPTPSGTKPDDDYSFDGKPTGGRPPYRGPGDQGQVEVPTKGPMINVQTTYDGKFTILTNIGDRHISFPPGVAVRAHVQSIDFLPYGSRIPSPSEQLKSDTANEILPQKREAPGFLIQETDDSRFASSSSASSEITELPPEGRPNPN